jgi:putative ATPase
MSTQSPLAEQLRPKRLDEYVGQKHLVGEQGVIRRVIEQKQIHSMIFWGPPGVGKTTLASLIAEELQAPFFVLSAINSGVKDIRAVIDQAEQSSQQALLFIDEIHRFSKSQQDSLLGAVEKGTVTLIGATTENPSFEVIAPLLSRCQVYLLEPLTQEDLEEILERAIAHLQKSCSYPIKVEEKEALFHFSGGDARKLLNAVDLSVKLIQPTDGVLVLNNEKVAQSIQKNIALYDKTGENHYDIISAFIKSMRGSDPNAALYWLARMLLAGEDPLFIARRMIILAAEDIGNANPNALLLANNCFQAVHQIGMPEARIVLSQTVIYLASSPKSNASYVAIDEAMEWVKKTGDLPVPLHLRNAPTKLMKDLNYGKDYRYAHNYQDNFVDQEFLPESISGKKFYEPQDNPRENELRRFLKNLWKGKYRYILLLLIFFFTQAPLQAQDMHYSQFYTAHYLINPALTGAFNGIFRANLNQKTQWISVTKPFLSLSANLDAPIWKNHKTEDLWGLGLQLNSDRAGDSEFQSIDINLSSSFIKNLGWRKKHKIGFGVVAGYKHQSLNYAALHFDEQFQNGVYNPQNPITEVFGDSKIFYFDLGAGVLWNYSFQKNSLISAGFSLFHINQPRTSFEHGTFQHPMRYCGYMTTRFHVMDEWNITPMVYATFQGKYKELIGGVSGEYLFKKNAYTTTAVLGFGLYYRWLDALIVEAHTDIQNLRIGISYDLNVSGFVPATKVRGGFEISLIYIYKKNLIQRIGREPCPYDIM